MPGDVQKNIQVQKRWTAAINQGDEAQILKAVDELFSEDYTLHDPTFSGPHVGRAIFKAGVESWLKENAGTHIVIDDIIGMEDRTAARITIEFENKTTHEKKKIVEVYFSRYVDGKIAEEWQVGWVGG